jgi:hypothetical protein
MVGVATVRVNFFDASTLKIMKEYDATLAIIHPR